ncbi:MAG: AMP-binding protein [Atopobiaceae bacterium]|jgi:D-alanine--poly(phosphoribitol) ligase subunit 1
MSRFLKRVGEQARRQAGVLAFANSDGERLSYGDLWAGSDRLACLLHASYAGDGPVAIYGHKSPLVPLAMLGCLKAGRPFVVIDSALPDKQAAEVLSSLGVAVGICVRPIPPDVTRGTGFGIALGTDELLACLVQLGDEEERILPKPSSSWVAKGRATVATYAEALPNDDARIAAELSLRRMSAIDLERLLSWCDTAFSSVAVPGIFLNQLSLSLHGSAVELVAALSSGGSVFAVSRDLAADPRGLQGALRRCRVTCWSSSASFAGLCLEFPQFNPDMLPRLTHVLVHEDGIMPKDSVLERMAERFPRSHAVA